MKLVLVWPGVASVVPWHTHIWLNHLSTSNTKCSFWFSDCLVALSNKLCEKLVASSAMSNFDQWLLRSAIFQNCERLLNACEWKSLFWRAGLPSGDTLDLAVGVFSAACPMFSIAFPMPSRLPRSRLLCLGASRRSCFVILREHACGNSFRQ